MMPATLPDPEQQGQEIEFNQTDRNVYAYLVYRANGARMCWKTVEEIKADLGIGTRQTVCNATAKLRRAGLIEVKHRRRDSNHYHILDPGRRLYPGSNGNGATEWQRQPAQDVKETVFQEPQGVKETALLNGHVDVKETGLLKPDDVKETALLGVLDVKETVHQSFNQDKITKFKRTKEGSERAPASRRPPARTPIPEDWQPNAESERYAAERGVPLAPNVRKFRNNHLSKRTVLADWQARFRMWCDEEERRIAERDERADSRGNPYVKITEREGWVSQRHDRDDEFGEAAMGRLIGHA